jgi:tetratricopeptide (TPR) repeat protein
LYSDSGNPKLDFVVALAETLEWPVDEVVDALWSGGEDAPGKGATSFEELDALALSAHARGAYAEMVEIAQRAQRAAATPDQRALACNREAGGWDGLGRYPKALEAVRRGLQESPLTNDVRLRLQGNLANAYYTLGELSPALGIAQVLVEWHRENPTNDPKKKRRTAFAHYVRGHAHRRLIGVEPENRASHAAHANEDLEAARELYTTLAEQLNDPSLKGIAHTCEGGLIEVGVELGRTTAESAVDRVLSELNGVVELDSAPTGDWLESCGWWAIFGGEIALRGLRGRRLQQSMAVFTNKALEIAERLDNWAMRERVFTMQYALHEVMVDSSDYDIDFTIDDEDRRLIAGTMGRFPRFRGVGWRILRTAKVVAAN